MKSSKTSFLRNCISGWNVRSSKGEELVGSKYCCIFVPPNRDEVTTQVAFLLGILRVSSL